MANPSTPRAGRYVQQLQGYRAFLPAPLPPDPPVALDGRLSLALSDANLALGRLGGSIQTLPNADHFVFMYIRNEAVLSSQIEGTHRSLITEKLGRSAGTGLRVHEHLYQAPIVSVADVAELTDTTFAGANQVIRRLNKAGIVTEMTGQSRNRRFLYKPYLDLFV